MTTPTVTLYPTPWFRNWKLYASAAAIVLVFLIFKAILPLPTMGDWILAVQVVFFIFLFNRPVWAMAALLVGQFTAANMMMPLAGGSLISIRFLWTIMAILILIPVLQMKGGIKLGSRTRNLLIPAAIFYALATLSNAVNLDTTNTYQYLRTGVTALSIIFFLPAVVRGEKDMKLLALVVLATCVFSSVAAIMQHYKHLGLPVLTLSGGIDAIRYGRTPGLTEGSINLAYGLPVAILPVFALLLVKGVGRTAVIVLPVLVLAMITGLYFSYTRSGMYSLLPGLLALVFLLKGEARRTMFIISAVLIVVFVLYINITSNRYSQGFGEESSATGRLYLWQAGAMIAMDNPLFGIGQGKFTEYSQLYSSEVEERSRVRIETVLGVEEAHNDFIRVWVSFGTPALIAYLWVFAVAFSNFIHGYRRTDSRFIRGMALGGFAALLAYIVNSFTHNLMDSVPILWILAGLSAAVVKMAEAKKPLAVAAGKASAAAPAPLPDSPSTQP
ncbi:MAG: hypothetical protein A2Y92_05510 [Chloroflexi bacterium RBG_13_57_8]|nr:MAG: hypothetical protein A2Y92_05510 [Chloroflexi bacterium RBG_13_57_8]